MEGSRVWQAKREYRSELAKRRGLRFLQYRQVSKQSCDIPKPLELQESINA
jgi:hypothetical protein